jgi:hypothetical protein
MGGQRRSEDLEPHLLTGVAEQRVRAGSTPSTSIWCHHRSHGLSGMPAVPEGDQDHRSVPIAASIGLAGLDQRLDFATPVS